MGLLFAVVFVLICVGFVASFGREAFRLYQRTEFGLPRTKQPFFQFDLRTGSVLVCVVGAIIGIVNWLVESWDTDLLDTIAVFVIGAVFGIAVVHSLRASGQLGRPPSRGDGSDADGMDSDADVE